MPDDVKPTRPLSDDERRAALKAARKQAREGRGVPHEEVRRWLDSWGTEEELPPPKCK
jgi:predicted transcriptional regulator